MTCKFNCKRKQVPKVTFLMTSALILWGTIHVFDKIFMFTKN